MKLRLQVSEIPPDDISKLFFKSTREDTEISIIDLKGKFDALGVPAKKGGLLARYLIEPLNQAEIVYNENAKSTQSEIILVLKDLIGDYKLYKQSEDQECDDSLYVSQELMQKLIVERFGRSKQSFIESLKCEDYDEEGILDLVQLKEAIISYDEDLDDELIDYILFYVFARSQSPDRMEYKVLIKLINDGLEQQKRI